MREEARRLLGCALFLFCAGGACASARAPASPEPPSNGPGACDTNALSRGLLPSDLGFSLSGLGTGDAVDRAQLAQLVRVAGEGLEVVIDPSPAEPAFADVAGEARCHPTELVVGVAGLPPRLIGVTWPALVVERVALAQSAQGRRQFPEARVQWQSALALVDAPALSVAAAETYLTEGRWDEASRAFQSVLQRAPWWSDAYRGLATAQRAQGRLRESISSYGRALALAPDDAALAATIGGMALGQVRPAVPPPARRRRTRGGPQWTVRAQPGVPDRLVRAEGRAYAACKEAFRVVRSFRERVTREELPLWRWSPAEESLCTALWLGVYESHRELGRPPNPAADDLVEIFRAGYLDERAVFDIGSASHPLAPRLLPSARRERLFDFVLRFRAGLRADGGAFFP